MHSTHSGIHLRNKTPRERIFRPSTYLSPRHQFCQAASLPPSTFQGRLLIVPRRGGQLKGRSPVEMQIPQKKPLPLPHLPDQREPEVWLTTEKSITYRKQSRCPELWIRILFYFRKTKMAFLFSLKLQGA